MATVTVVKALTGFFNTGEGESVASDGGLNVPATVAGTPVKRGVTAWRNELSALTTEEKRALALEVCAVTGDTLS